MTDLRERVARWLRNEVMGVDWERTPEHDKHAEELADSLLSLLAEQEPVGKQMEQLAEKYLGEIAWTQATPMERELVESNVCNFAGFVAHYLHPPQAARDHEAMEKLRSKKGVLCFSGGDWIYNSDEPPYPYRVGSDPADAILGEKVEP